MARAALAVLLAVVACSLTVPTVEHQDPRHPCPYPAADVELLRAVLINAWWDVYGEDVARYARDITVQCVPHTWEVEGADGQVSGQTLNPRRVRIAYMGGDMSSVWPLRRTALAHEYTHAILWARDGDPDDDHAGPYWDLEAETRARLYGYQERGCPLQ